ncbi:MAG TPA: hypothetical protein VFO41_10690 [Alphaproteobacteria bacterium]|nr:hypothetical protein [Alphaproteobacteria bacterium]
MTVGPQANEALVKRIEERLREPVYFRDIVAAASDQPYRALLQAWSEVRIRHRLERDEFGRYWRSGS